MTIKVNHIEKTFVSLISLLLSVVVFSSLRLTCSVMFMHREMPKMPFITTKQCHKWTITSSCYTWRSVIRYCLDYVLQVHRIRHSTHIATFYMRLRYDTDDSFWHTREIITFGFNFLIFGMVSRLIDCNNITGYNECVLRKYTTYKKRLVED